jgi:hypothetical protein
MSEDKLAKEKYGQSKEPMSLLHTDLAIAYDDDSNRTKRIAHTQSSLFSPPSEMRSSPPCPSSKSPSNYSRRDRND